MPRAQRNTTVRKFGIEMEGYVSSYPRNMRIQGASIKRDVSLYNSRWTRGYDRFGVEVVSRPIKTLSIVSRIFGEMQQQGWSQDERAGTHVHIDISDYTEFEKAKLLRFCKGIERIIYLFVKDYRFDNRFCRRISDGWRKIFKLKKKFKVEYNETALNTAYRLGLDATNSKYYWCNIYGSRHRTAEFRLFHCVTSGEEAVKFVRLAHAIVELCKVATPEQLEFIILSLYESDNVETCANNFYHVLGLSQEHRLPIVGTGARDYLAGKLSKNKAKRAKEQLVAVGA